MDIVLNDYSLNEQFDSIEQFVLWVQKELVKMFDYCEEHKIALYKKSDFYSKKITKNDSIQDLLKISGDPLVARIRKFIINSAFEPPYWDESDIQKTYLTNSYKCPYEHDLPNCFSEAIERDRTILSIKNSQFTDEFYHYIKNGEQGKIFNIIDYNSFLRRLLEKKNESVRYVFENYKYERKVIFMEYAGKCYAEEAIQQNELTAEDKRNVLINISHLITGLSSGTKNRFWDSLCDGIFEYRISISSGREFRLLFIQDEAIIFLNGFIKKVQRTPKYEIDKAKILKNKYFGSRVKINK